MKYYFALLVLYFFSGTAQASGVLPIHVPPPPVTDSLHRDPPAGVENNSTLTKRQHGTYHLPMSDLTKFFIRGKGNTIKKFNWGGFRYQVSLGKCYIPPRYRVHVHKPGKHYLGDVDMDLLEANVRDVVGSKSRTLLPDQVVDFKLADFFYTDGERAGVGAFNRAEFEHWFHQGIVQVPVRFMKPNGELDVQRLHDSMDELGQSTEKHINEQHTALKKRVDVEADIERLMSQRWGTQEDYLKIRHYWLENNEDAIFTLRDFFTAPDDFPNRIGHFRFDLFRQQWNKGRVFVPEDFLNADGELDFHGLDRFVRRLEGSARGRYAIPTDKLTRDEPEKIQPPKEPSPERVPPFNEENLPTDPFDNAGRFAPRAETGSRFGRLKINMFSRTKAVEVGGIPEPELVGGEALEKLSPSRIAELGTRISSALEFSFLDFAIAGVVFAIPIVLGFIIEGIVEAVQYECEKKHGGPEGCQRHHDENLYLREKKIDDHHKEAEHKGEHKKEEAKIKNSHERHAARRRHRVIEAQEKKDDDAARDKERADFDARDRANREMDDRVNRDLKEMDDYEKKHNHHKRFEVFGSMVEFSDSQIDHAMTWFSEPAENEDEKGADEDAQWPTRD